MMFQPLTEFLIQTSAPPQSSATDRIPDVTGAVAPPSGSALISLEHRRFVPGAPPPERRLARGFLSVIKRPNLHDASASTEKPGQLRSPGGRCLFRPPLARFHSNNSQIVREISALVHSLRPTFVMQFRSFYN
jgi:hypothetical protein